MAFLCRLKQLRRLHFNVTASLQSPHPRSLNSNRVLLGSVVGIIPDWKISRRSSEFCDNSRFFAAPFQPKQKEEKDSTGPRLNDKITGDVVRLVISDEEHFIMSLKEAFQRAQRLGMDLVEVNRKAEPPVVKIMDFHKEKYVRKLKEKEISKTKTKLKTAECKEIRLTPKIEQKDLEMKAKNALRSMESGYRVKCTVSRKESEDAGGTLARLCSLVQSSVTFQLHPLILKRYGTSPSNDSQIIDLCRTGSLLEALNILYHSNPIVIHSKTLVYASLIQTSIKVDSFRHGIQLHAQVVKNGLQGDCFVGNSLLTLYFKLGSDFSETRRVFDGLVYRDVVSWTSMIIGYVRVRMPVKSIEVFREMLGCGYIQPNDITFYAVIKACAELEGATELGKCFHGVVVKYGYGSESVVLSSLINMYGRNGEYLYAWMVFDKMPEPDASSWSCLISAFIRNGLYEKALCLFHSMQMSSGVCPDKFTFGPVLTACGNLERLKQGKQVHAKALTFGISENVVIKSSLVGIYGKCGLVDKARRIIDSTEEYNSVSWGALLDGYCQNGDFKSVFDLCRVMGMLDLYFCGTILRACTGLTALRQGKEVHCQYVKGNGNDVVIETALIDMYAKCGHIEQAERLFGLMTAKSTRTWNSMIFGYAQNGRAEESLQVFDKMVAEGIKPNSVSFIGVLFSCTHTGLLEHGKKYFRVMTDEYDIQPDVQHYNCMIDLVGRAGYLEEAEMMLMSSEFKDDASVWAVLLASASATGTSSATAVRIAERMMKLDPKNHLSYVYLANIYRATGHWEKASNIIELMKQRRINKSRGRSWIDIDHCIAKYAQQAA